MKSILALAALLALVFVGCEEGDDVEMVKLHGRMVPQESRIDTVITDCPFCNHVDTTYTASDRYVRNVEEDGTYTDYYDNWAGRASIDGTVYGGVCGFCGKNWDGDAVDPITTPTTFIRIERKLDSSKSAL